MSNFMKPRTLAIGAGTLGLLYFTGLPFNPFRTSATKNIGDRMAAGGGTDTHAPGTATPRGTSADVEPTEKNKGGIDSPHFKENVANQRPGAPGPFDKKWNDAHYGTEKGK